MNRRTKREPLRFSTIEYMALKMVIDSQLEMGGISKRYREALFRVVAKTERARARERVK